LLCWPNARSLARIVFLADTYAVLAEKWQGYLAIATFCLAAGFSLAWGESLNVARFGMWIGKFKFPFS